MNSNNKSIETIKILEDKITMIQMSKSSLVVKSDDSQTFCSDISISCNICIFVASCEEELNWHMGDTYDLFDESCHDNTHARTSE